MSSQTGEQPQNVIESSKFQEFETEALVGQDHNLEQNNPESVPNLQGNSEFIPTQNQELSSEINSLVNPQTQRSDNNILPSEEEKTIKTNPKNIFLKSKMDKMKVNKNIIKGVNKSIDKQMKRIEIDFKDDQILLTEIPKNINQYIVNRQTSKNLISGSKTQSIDINEGKTPLEVFELKQEYKAIKELKKEKDSLTKKLNKLLENEKLMNSDAYINLTFANKPDLTVTKNLLLKEKKDMAEKKNDLLKKISEIESKLDKYFTKNDPLTRKKRVQSFIDNFEKDKEIIEERARKYMQESQERKKRHEKDIIQMAEKRKKEMEDKDKEIEQQKNEMIKKFKEQEKAIELKKQKEIQDKILKFKPFIHEKFKGKTENYLYAKSQNEFEKKEEDLIKKENFRRRDFMKPMDNKEMEKFGKDYKELREKALFDINGKKQKLLSEWKGRKDQLPTYVPESYDKSQKDQKTKSIIDDEKKKMTEGLNLKKIEYSKGVKEKKIPKINEKLKKERIDTIKSLENPKLAIKEESLLKRRSKELFSAKLLETNNSSTITGSNNKVIIKIRTKPKDDSDIRKSIKENLIPKIRKGSGINPMGKSITIPRKPLTKRIDYLAQMIEEKNKKEKERIESLDIKDNNNSVSNKKSRASSNDKTTKWLKFLNEENTDVIGNINIVKKKCENIDEAVKINEEMLKLHGGIKNDPELGQKVSNLLIDSISAKLSILTKLNG